MSITSRRLDYYTWYDKKKDLISCLDCKKKYEALITSHVKKHGYKNLRNYKLLNSISPNTPLRSKRLLNILSIHAKKMRKKGKFKVFKKGETSIPLKYRKNINLKIAIRRLSMNPEIEKLRADSLSGRKVGFIGRRKLSLCRKGVIPFHLKKFSYKKGHKPPHFNSTWRKTYGIKKYRKMVKNMILNRFLYKPIEEQLLIEKNNYE